MANYSRRNDPAGKPLIFTPLSQVQNNLDQFVDLLGAIAEYREPMKCHGTGLFPELRALSSIFEVDMLRRNLGTDWTLSLKLCDKTKSSLENGMTIRFFRPMVEALPKIQSVDDIIVITNVKVDLPESHPISKQSDTNGLDTTSGWCLYRSLELDDKLDSLSPLSDYPKSHQLSFIKFRHFKCTPHHPDTNYTGLVDNPWRSRRSSRSCPPSILQGTGGQ